MMAKYQDCSNIGVLADGNLLAHGFVYLAKPKNMPVDYWQGWLTVCQEGEFYMNLMGDDDVVRRPADLDFVILDSLEPLIQTIDESIVTSEAALNSYYDKMKASFIASLAVDSDNSTNLYYSSLAVEAFVRLLKSTPHHGS